jgi:hypothetical protein
MKRVVIPADCLPTDSRLFSVSAARDDRTREGGGMAPRNPAKAVAYASAQLGSGGDPSARSYADAWTRRMDPMRDDVRRRCAATEEWACLHQTHPMAQRMSRCATGSPQAQMRERQLLVPRSPRARPALAPRSPLRAMSLAVRWSHPGAPMPPSAAPVGGWRSRAGWRRRGERRCPAAR